VAKKKPIRDEPVKPKARMLYVQRAIAGEHYKIAGGKASANLILNAQTGATSASLGTLHSDSRELVFAEHVHEKEDEYLYMATGKGILTIEGKDFVAEAPCALFIPKGSLHMFTLDPEGGSLNAVQFFTPGGPEGRFRKGEFVMPPHPKPEY